MGIHLTSTNSSSTTVRASGASGTTEIPDSAQAPPPHIRDSSPIPNEECHKPSHRSSGEDTNPQVQRSSHFYRAGNQAIVNHSTDSSLHRPGVCLRYGRKVVRPAFSFSKMKAVYFPDVGLEQWCLISYGLKGVQVESHQHLMGCPPEGFEIKHDYTVIRLIQGAVTLEKIRGADDLYEVLEIHKFSYGTLHNRSIRFQKQGVHVRYKYTTKDSTYIRKSGSFVGGKIRGRLQYYRLLIENE
ncbi:hypothetical protein Tco_0531948 [Tanacetum coccineum]